MLSLSKPQHPFPCTGGFSVLLGHLTSILWFPSSFKIKQTKTKNTPFIPLPFYLQPSSFVPLSSRAAQENLLELFFPPSLLSVTRAVGAHPYPAPRPLSPDAQGLVRAAHHLSHLSHHAQHIPQLTTPNSVPSRLFTAHSPRCLLHTPQSLVLGPPYLSLRTRACQGPT